MKDILYAVNYREEPLARAITNGIKINSLKAIKEAQKELNTVMLILDNQLKFK
jgi:hypothetical protein